MPLYEYRCRGCGASVEEVQPMGAPPPGPCPECGEELSKVYGRVAVKFSGWGFRRTDGLISGDDRPRKDFRALAEKAEEIAEG